MITRRRLLTISACALASSAFSSAPILWRGRGLGAEIVLQLHTNDALAQEAIKRTSALIKTVEQQFSLYSPQSAVSRLNRNKSIRMSPFFKKIVILSDTMHELTDGYFDPSVQGQFASLQVSSNLARWSDVRHVGDMLNILPNQSLTFNGIVQGAATDLVRQTLEGLGMHKVLVNMGEYAALGGPWRLGISDPEKGLFDEIEIHDRAISTSSPQATFLNGKPHIQNPKNHTQPRFSTLSVVHDTAALADGLSTALVFGDDQLINRVMRSKLAPVSIVGLRNSGEHVVWNAA